MSDLNQLLDKILMLKMGNAGNSQAHIFLEDRAIGYGSVTPETARNHIRCGSCREFIPPKSEDRVLMFADNSGVYVHKSGLCTIMGTDISHEVGAWEEVAQ